MRSIRPSLLLLPCLLLLLGISRTADAKRDLKSACTTCRQVTDNFKKGIERTAKQGFGGGNTAWEERTLSKYETSEIRLTEILEAVCDSSSFECNRMVEEHEDLFETWWFKRKTKHPDLHKWFCVESVKVCCPKGAYGPQCKDCVGGSDRPCHGNGACDGDATRGGDGRCSCNHGYEGESCLECIDGYFGEVKNDTFTLCSECHASCQSCSGGTNQDCDECKAGWEEDEQDACVDVNECSKDPAPCGEEEYCINNDGSFSCKGCDKVCSGCTGAGANGCRDCAAGYHDVEGTCTDVDECSGGGGAAAVWAADHQQCVNTPGAHLCVCAEGHEEGDGGCVPRALSEEPDEEEPATEPPQAHDDL
ncbi:cysteine-rich with EGF-like domain protein 2 isoform X1 [Gadus chalcogrammus]|uniref:cysteine-rich with EGF-like domain protein 2 isoform X1 n=1 Tax=Gadus chalcogrammus TaxID=1042646 RepID=UPI0024C49615|nr:cysteine-rich with EGF-like domain protein 2 isoform X1 [Gadus chalcogrammus]